MNTKALPSSEELIIRFKETGDPVSFSTLVERHQKHIQQKCLSYVRDSDIAQDLCQEVLIKLYLQIKNFRNQAKFNTWLFSIIHNTCIDHLRKHNKNVRAVITDKLTDGLADIVDDQDDIPPQVSMKILDDLLEQMTPEDKMLLLMKYKEKHNIKDIQRTLGVSESAIKMRLKRARDKINRLYQRYGN